MTSLSINLPMPLFAYLAKAGYEDIVGEIRLYRIIHYTPFSCKLISEKKFNKSNPDVLSVYCYDKNIISKQELRIILKEQNKSDQLFVDFIEYQQLKEHLNQSDIKLIAKFKRSESKVQSKNINFGEKQYLLSSNDTGNYQYSILLWPDESEQLKIYLGLSLQIGEQSFELDPVRSTESSKSKGNGIVGYDISIDFKSIDEVTFELVTFRLNNGIITAQT